MLSRKMLRTVLRYKTQFISMIVMIALGAGVFIGFNMEWHSIETDVNYALDSTGFADYRLIDSGGFSETDLDSIKAIDGVDGAARFLSVNTKLKGSDHTITLTVTTDPKISGFSVMSGEPYDPDSTDGIWLSDRYAEKNGVHTGDAMTVTYKGVEVTGHVKGLIKSGEYMIYLADDKMMMPDFSTSGFAYISPSMLESSLGYQYYNQINVLSGLDRKEFSSRADQALGMVTLCIPKEDTVAYSEAMGEVEEGKTMASILPVLFLVIAALTMVTTMHRITTNEKIQIGTLKALGFRDGRIKAHYSTFALAIGIAGTALGALFGWALAYYIMNPNGSMGTYMDLPKWDLTLPGYTYVVIVAMNVLLVAVGYVSVCGVLRGSAADSLRPHVPRHIKRLWIERTGLWSKLGFGTRWNLRDTFRHKSRSLMTILGVMGCVVLLTASSGMKDTADSFIDTFYGEGINYETVIYMSDDADNDDAKSLCATYSGDWAARSQVLLGDAPVGLEIYNVSNDHIRFFDRNLDRVKLENGGAYICKRISEDTGLHVGDTLTFTTFGTSQTYSVKIIGMLNSISKSIIMTSDSADAAGIDYDINTVYTDATDIPASPLIDSTASKASVMKSFDSFMKVMNDLIFLLMIAAVILCLIVLYNLGTLSYIERVNEMATLKVVGFRDSQIEGILISQNVWMTVLGILIGLPLGVFVLDYLLVALAAEYEMVLTIKWTTYLISVAVTLIVSVLVSGAVSRNNRKIDMVQALKGTE